jgi:hypothetical protein
VKPNVLENQSLPPNLTVPLKITVLDIPDVSLKVSLLNALFVAPKIDELLTTLLSLTTSDILTTKDLPNERELE